MRPLSAKLLERPTLLTRIRWAIADLERCHLVPYVSTELEQAVGDALGIPVHGADPALAYLGTKSGSRELFARAGVPHPLGVEHDHAAAPTRSPRSPACAPRKPRLRQVVVKLDAGVSGEGNAIVELRRAAAARRAHRAARGSASASTRCDCEAAGVSLSVYLERLSRGGDRRGADRRRRAAQPERPARADARRRGADRLHARPDPRRPALPRLPLPGRAGVRAARSPRARGGSAHCWPRPARVGRAGIDFVVARDADGVWQRVRDRGQPAQRRHDASAGGARAALAAAPTTPTTAIFTRPVRLAAPLRRHRPSRVAAAAGARPRRPAAAGRAAAAGGGRLRRRLPHAELARRARPRRPDRDRQHGRRRAEPLRAGAGDCCSPRPPSTGLADSLWTLSHRH